MKVSKMLESVPIIAVALAFSNCDKQYTTTSFNKLNDPVQIAEVVEINGPGKIDLNLIGKDIQLESALTRNATLPKEFSYRAHLTFTIDLSVTDSIGVLTWYSDMTSPDDPDPESGIGLPMKKVGDRYAVVSEFGHLKVGHHYVITIAQGITIKPTPNTPIKDTTGTYTSIVRRRISIDLTGVPAN